MGGNICTGVLVRFLKASMKASSSSLLPGNDSASVSPVFLGPTSLWIWRSGSPITCGSGVFLTARFLFFGAGSVDVLSSDESWADWGVSTCSASRFAPCAAGT